MMDMVKADGEFQHVSATIYIGNHFETRDHDEPVKYVLREETRIARITGSLSHRTHLQRLRLRNGWNSVSLAVNAVHFVQQLQTSRLGGNTAFQVLRWELSSRTFLKVAHDEDLPAGSVLWIYSPNSGIAVISGDYLEPADRQIAAQGTFAPSFGLESWDADFPSGVTVWKFDGAARWQVGFSGNLVNQGNFPGFVAPGEAIFVAAEEEILLPTPPAPLRIRYYHPDHLGSVAVISDAQGFIVEETAYYPFGIPRHESRPRTTIEPYQFTGMERDRESALFSFGARFYDAALPRFTRVDPLASDVPIEWLATPQKLNTYAYVANNPVNFVDPTGLDGERPQSKVLVVYGYDMYENFKKEVPGNPSRAQYEAALRKAYAHEAAGSEIVVKNIESKESLKKALEGSTYSQLIFNTHGYLNYKAIRLGPKSHLSPDDLARYLGGAKKTPEKMYFYGCNTAKTGFAENLSNTLKGVEVTGATDIIKPSYKWDTKGQKITGYTIEETRIYNKTYKDGSETYDARKIDINAPISP